MIFSVDKDQHHKGCKVYISKNGCSVRLVIIRLPVQKNDVGHVQFGKVEAMVARPIPGLFIFKL